MSIITTEFIPTMKTVIETMLGSLGCIYEYRHSLFKALIIPVSLNLLMTLANYLLDIPVELTFLLAIAWTYLYAQIAITTLRILLLGPELASEWAMFSFNWAVLKFIMHGALLGLFALPAALLLLIPNVGGTLFILLSIYIVSRLSLVFPSIAIGKDLSFVDSWHATKDHQVLMFLVVGIIPGCFVAIQAILQKTVYSYFLVTVLGNLSLILIASVLSISYKIVFKTEQEKNQMLRVIDA